MPPRRIIFKNASSGQKGVTIQRRVQDTSLLWERTRIECSFDVELFTEEVLILLLGRTGNTYLSDESFAGDNKRFIKIDYARDKSHPPSKFEEFKAKNKGLTKSQQYASIRANITQGAFFDNKNAFTIGNTIKSVCTDGAYLGVIRQYHIYISQTLKNITTLDDLDKIDVYFVADGGDGVKTMSRLETWNKLYILEPREEPYQIQPRFFGDTGDVVSTNNFWVLPPQFKKYGITYELYHYGPIPRVLDKLSDINDCTFSILNDNLRIEGHDIFCSYTHLYGAQQTSGTFTYITDATDVLAGTYYIASRNIDEFGELSYNSVIECTSYEIDGVTPYHRFSFINNIADGLMGYYHQLDETKTTSNKIGFFEEGVYKRGEDIANILLNLNAYRWFSDILKIRIDLSTSFDYDSANNRLRGGGPVIGSDGVERYTFIDNIDQNKLKTITGTAGSVRNFSGFTFKRISFIDTQIVKCIFTGAHFEECDFTRVEFSDCNFTNVTSKRNIWDNFNERLILHGDKPLQPGHKLIGGRIIGDDITESGEYYNYTKLRSYDERTTAVRNVNTDNDVIMDFTDSLRIDEVIFRTYIEVDPYVKVIIDLSYVNLDDVSATDISSLEQPFNIFVRESGDAGYIQDNSLNSRLVLLVPPENHRNRTLYNIDTSSSDISASEYYYRKYADYYSEASLMDHAVENPLFYNYQFQKDLTNRNGIKLFGFNNTNSNDNHHVGSWGIGVYPYNTINSNDVMLQFVQTMSTTFGYNVVGPLTHYKLDEGYNKYTGVGGVQFMHNGKPTNFKLRKGNLNYEYIDTTSARVADSIKDISGILWKAEIETFDPSLTRPNVGDLFNKLDDEYISNRDQSNVLLHFL